MEAAQQVSEAQLCSSSQEVTTRQKPLRAISIKKQLFCNFVPPLGEIPPSCQWHTNTHRNMETCTRQVQRLISVLWQSRFFHWGFAMLGLLKVIRAFPVSAWVQWATGDTDRQLDSDAHTNKSRTHKSLKLRNLTQCKKDTGCSRNLSRKNTFQANLVLKSTFLLYILSHSFVNECKVLLLLFGKEGYENVMVPASQDIAFLFLWGFTGAWGLSPSSPENKHDTLLGNPLFPHFYMFSKHQIFICSYKCLHSISWLCIDIFWITAKSKLFWVRTLTCSSVRQPMLVDGRWNRTGRQVPLRLLWKNEMRRAFWLRRELENTENGEIH